MTAARNRERFEIWGVAEEALPYGTERVRQWSEKAKPRPRGAEVPLQLLVAHNFSPAPVEKQQPGQGEFFEELDADDAGLEAAPEEIGLGDELDEGLDEDLENWREDVWLYRNRTQSMLRRYMRYSLETGRIQSILGREFFRGKVSTYTVTTFEDRVIFVHDMERCLEKLDQFSRELVTRVVMQEHYPEDIRVGYRLPRRSIYRRLGEALDELSGVLLERGLLEKNMLG
jgi:hypothetical protein